MPIELNISTNYIHGIFLQVNTKIQLTNCVFFHVIM